MMKGWTRYLKTILPNGNIIIMSGEGGGGSHPKQNMPPLSHQKNWDGFLVSSFNLKIKLTVEWLLIRFPPSLWICPKDLFFSVDHKILLDRLRWPPFECCFFALFCRWLLIGASSIDPAALFVPSMPHFWVVYPGFIPIDIDQQL